MIFFAFIHYKITIFANAKVTEIIYIRAKNSIFFMKRNLSIIAGLLIFSIVTIATLISCDKDTDCKLKVNVVTREGRAKPWVSISINQKGAQLGQTGYTDAEGRFEATFSAPAIYNIVVMDTINEWVYNDVVIDEFGNTRRDSNYVFVGYYTGRETVRLKDGETVEKTVVLDNHNLVQVAK